MKQIYIKGIPLSILDRSEYEKTFSDMLSSVSFHHIVTLNPEMVVYANRHELFTSILRNETFNTADGFGIILAAKYKGLDLTAKDRLTGVDLTRLLLTYAERMSLSASILIPKNSLSKPDAIKKSLENSYPNLSTDVIVLGDRSVEAIHQNNSSIVFVALGSPAQEYWIHTNRHKLKNVRIAVGIGGTFDFISDTIKRAPAPFRFLGLEWIWRFILEPKRFGRIVRAVILFPLIIILDHE